ncbi:hypothetical protein ABT160_28380 [Streptomyces sp. NPDC001941]|uniref:hypothetical protein n=1 Tax=Streptomyces sp. NPDC001941 TaxID=3154659 RepID=UPI0033177EEE
MAVVGLAVAVLTACSGAPSPESTTQGAKDERGAVDAYIAALNAVDSAGLAALAPPGNDATADVASRLKSRGGRVLKVTEVKIEHGFGPDVASAEVHVTDKAGVKSQEYLTLSRFDDGWHVTLGSNPNVTKKPSSSTQRP